MLTELQKRKLTRYFRVYDVDNDGRVGHADFERVLENVRALHGLSADSSTYLALRHGFMNHWDTLRWWADRDGDGGVDLEEWLDYWDELLGREQRYEDEVASVLARLFSLFDTDSDGVLGPDEFADFYGVYGLSAALARSVFVDLDANGDGVISRDELEDISHHFYRGDDPKARGNLLYGPY